jgi:glycosyltransferase involved in cell wall biosynthesis
MLAPLFPSLIAPEPSPVPERGPVVFSGRVTPAKGVGTFLRAMATLDAPAEVCGDGWWLPQARRLAARLKIAGRVIFRGWLDPGELEAAYRRARVVVVPSHWPEPFGLVGIEAMSHGRPVVGAATGGIPEWLEDGSTGTLVAPGDAAALGSAVGRLLADPALARSLGERGAERVAARFNRDLYLDAISLAYATADEHWRRSR